MEKTSYSISEAGKLVGVESHVLRYWEDELQLDIPRNGKSHRYYTELHIRLFQKIKELKEKGYQLKAIEQVLKCGKYFKRRKCRGRNGRGNQFKNHTKTGNHSHCH